MSLKNSANWNQVERDWERILHLQPDGCFGLFSGSRLACTATALTYKQDLAWIGMVLTLPEFRGRGFASQIMTRCIEFLEAAGVTEVKLDATNLGIEIYRRFGFVDECPIERWERKPSHFDSLPGPAPAAGTFDPELDRRAFGTDRQIVLEHLRKSGAMAVRDGGYAMSREGSHAAYAGPCVARDPETARHLLAGLLAPQAGSTVYWDLFPDHAAAVEIARSFGFEPVRRLTRMTRVLGPGQRRVSPDNSLVYAIAGFELG